MKRKLSKSLSIILTMTIVISAIIIAPVTVSAANTADSIVDIARAEIGNSYYQKYNGHKNAWCADFVTWCAKQAGVSSIASSSSCYNMYMGMKDSCERVYSPQKGDIVFFYCNKCSTTAGKWCHVGIMEDSTHSIEGNNWSDGTSKVQRGKSYNHNGDLGYRHGDSSGCITRIYLRPNYSKPTPNKWYDDLSLVNLGDNFTARIRNIDLDVLLTNFNGNVVIGKHYDYKIARQIWNFKRNSNGSYTIKSALNDNCIDLHNFDDFNGGNIECIGENNSTAQHWFIYQNKDGSYSLRPECSQDRVMDVTNGYSSDGTNLQLWQYTDDKNQKFSIDECGEVINAGNYFSASIENTNYWKPIYQDESGNVTLTTSTRDKMSGILWHFVRDDDNGWYTIQSYKNGKYLTVENNSIEDGANVSCSEYSGDYGQFWYLLKAEDDNGEYLYLKSACSSKNLDLYNNEKSDGTNIQMWSINGTDAQKFSIYEINSKTTYSINIEKDNLNLGESTNIFINDTNFVIDYKLYIVMPDGQTKVIDNKCSYKYLFTPEQVGQYIIYAEVKSPVSSSIGSSSDRCVVVNVLNKKCDVDLDNSVTVADATLLQKYVVGIATLTDDQKLLADCNGDGAIDVRDATYIQKTIVKIPV